MKLLILFLSFNALAIDKSLESLLSQSVINPEERAFICTKTAHFLKTGTTPNARTPQGYTLLMRAVWHRLPSVVKILLDYGADPNLKDFNPSEQSTALLYALMVFDSESVALLLEHAADPNIQNFYGETALWWAARIGDTKSVQLLLEQGANPNLRTLHGDTALIKAVENNRIEAVRLLLAHHADKAIAKNNGDTPLVIARNKDLREIIKLLT